MTAFQSPHMKSHALVAVEFLGAIACLASGNAANRAELGEHGACDGACVACEQMALFMVALILSCLSSFQNSWMKYICSPVVSNSAMIRCVCMFPT